MSVPHPSASSANEPLITGVPSTQQSSPSAPPAPPAPPAQAPQAAAPSAYSAAAPGMPQQQAANPAIPAPSAYSAAGTQAAPASGAYPQAPQAAAPSAYSAAGTQAAPASGAYPQAPQAVNSAQGYVPAPSAATAAYPTGAMPAVGQPGVYGQPYGRPAQPDALAPIKAIFTTIGLLFRGRIYEAVNVMIANQASRLISLISLPIAFGLYLVVLAYQATNAYNSLVSAILPFGLGMYSLEFSDVMTFFVAGLLICAIIIAASLAVMRLCCALRHSPVTLPQLTGIYTVGITPLVIVMPPAVLLSIVPWSGLISLVLVVVLIVAVFTALLSFLTTYMGMERLGRFSTPVVVPYVLMSMAASALVLIILVFLAAH